MRPRTRPESVRLRPKIFCEAKAKTYENEATKFGLEAVLASRPCWPRGLNIPFQCILHSIAANFCMNLFFLNIYICYCRALLPILTVAVVL